MIPRPASHGNDLLPELTAVVLRLTPESGEPLPPDVGRYAHAALLHLVHRKDPALAQGLHDRAASRPFTLAVLSGSPRNRELLMRVTSLEPQLTAVLSRVVDGPGRPIVSLGVSHFSITYAQQGPAVTLWRREQRWCLLAAGAGQQRSLTLLFASPTTFSFGQRKVPLPLPELVFGSLLKKWNTFSPLRFSSGLLALFRERLAVSEVHNLNTQMLDFGRYKEKGFVGQVAYEALGPWSDEELRALNALADFAFYSGVGYKTTMGMGLARRVLSPSKARVKGGD